MDHIAAVTRLKLTRIVDTETNPHRIGMLRGCERWSGHDSRDIVDWEKFRPIISDMYRVNQEIGADHTMMRS